MIKYTKEYFDLRDKVEKLAQEKYDKDSYAALWGSAQTFLTEENLKIMERVMSK